MNGQTINNGNNSRIMTNRNWIANLKKIRDNDIDILYQMSNIYLKDKNLTYFIIYKLF